MSSNVKELQPLQELLASVVARLETLERKVGVDSSSTVRSVVGGAAAGNDSSTPAISPAIQAYDTLLEKSVAPLADACNALNSGGGGGLKNMGDLLKDAWGSLRTIVELASRSKMPPDIQGGLQPHLATTQKSVQALRALRLDRKYDYHIKAVMEMATCLSWVLVRPPPQAPVAFCKEASASCDFWLNKIRKEYKTTDPLHIAFCDSLKKLLLDLMEYITEYHKIGLAWNPHGVSLAEAAAAPSPAANASVPPPKSARGATTGGAVNLLAELSQKRNADGSSAATGLKHVNKDQQTWRKEFKGEKSAVVPVTAMTAVSLKKTKDEPKKKVGTPICQYQDRGFKWVVENQTKESVGGKVLTVDIKDPKQQVYMFNCEHMTLQIQGGKFKSIVLDRCENCNVIFETVISACEMVNCKKIQVQTTGVCPSFSIDKTEGCLVYLSKESLAITSFVTSLSTEMNVSFPDGDEQKELPIPEQFVHKLVNGALTSEVSDLYN